MNTRRAILFSSYEFLRTTGYFAVRNRVAPYATVLTFHRVNDKDSHSLSVHPSMFDELLEILSREYRIVSFSQLRDELCGDGGVKAKTVVITFDDGYLDNFSVAAPILKQREVPATFFVTSGYINTKHVFPWDLKNAISHPLMTWDHVRQLAAEGFEIGAHSINHPNIGKCSPEIARAEIIGSKRCIEDRLGKPVFGFAYPFGGPYCMSEASSQIVKEAGYSYSCSNYGGRVRNGANLYNIQRIGVYPTALEMQMEIDNFMTYYDGTMLMHFLGAALPISHCSKPGDEYT